MQQSPNVINYLSKYSSTNPCMLLLVSYSQYWPNHLQDEGSTKVAFRCQSYRIIYLYYNLISKSLIKYFACKTASHRCAEPSPQITKRRDYYDIK